jgi:hypothetical protein
MIDVDFKGWFSLAASRVPSCYVALLIPLVLFIVSLYIRPAINTDSGFGFLVFRGMLDYGNSFNVLIEPDAADIANDVAKFQTWWSPGQYLVPGFFVWLGTNYGLALSLTTFISTVIGVIGWAQVAQSFGVTHFVLLVFLFGLVTFRYVTLPFEMYPGGEVLLFAVAPWCLYWLRYAVDKPAIACFAISLLSAALLFFAKLTGLVVFAANVVAISLLEIARQRRLSVSVLAMLAAAAVAALCFVVFWLARGKVPASGGRLSLTWPAILFPVSAAAFSGFSALDFLRMRGASLSNLLATTYILGPLGLTLFVWIWYRLRHTPYRTMATILFGIILLYTSSLGLMYIRGALVSFDERHLRYAGTLSLLLLLVALDQRGRTVVAKRVALISIAMFALYGLTSYAAGARGLMRGAYYDPLSGTSQRIVSPVVLEYLRAEMKGHNWERAIAVIPTPEAAIAIPRFRIIIASWQNCFGRAEKIFVVVPEWLSDRAEGLLNSFVDYRRNEWSELHIGKTVIYSQ